MPPTAPVTAASKPRGYLTLNPFKYAHPLLSIVLPLFFILIGGIGLPGGAVYLHPHLFRSKRAQALAAAVGPATNLVVAVVLLLLVRSQRRLRAHPVLVRARLPRVPAGDRGGAQPAADPGPRRLLDHRAVPRPPDPELGDKIKPWGMIGVIVLLQFRPLNDAFFSFAGWLYDRSGASGFLWLIGREFFKFWVKNPL